MTMAKKPTATKKTAAVEAPEVTAPEVTNAEVSQVETADAAIFEGDPVAEPSAPAAEPTHDGAREPWPVRLAKMSADDIRTLLQGNTLGERKRGEAKARLASL
jgi:hypothetical protein